MFIVINKLLEDIVSFCHQFNHLWSFSLNQSIENNSNENHHNENEIENHLRMKKYELRDFMNVMYEFVLEFLDLLSKNDFHEKLSALNSLLSKALSILKNDFERVLNCFMSRDSLESRQIVDKVHDVLQELSRFIHNTN